MLTFKFKPKFSIIIALLFIASTVIGTLSHEFGHIIVAKSLGYKTVLHYGSMDFNYSDDVYESDKDFIEIKSLTNEFENEITNNKPFAKKQRYTELVNLLSERYDISIKDKLYTRIGGPVLTIITSLIGLYILYRRESKHRYTFRKIDWLGVFLGLFILREIFNFAGGVYGSLAFNKSNFNADEFTISRYLNLNEWVVPTIALIPAVLISAYIIFKVVPIRYRFSFIVSGFIGGILGFAFWFGFLGPILLP